jgi:dolichol-phosphate mannosyltransferase
MWSTATQQNLEKLILVDIAPRVVVVVPTYNERDSLPLLVDQLADLKFPNLHVLIVDDNSPDGTGAIADTLAANSHGTVGVLHRSQKIGLGRAYVAGMMRALSDGASIVIQMDADLSHPVAIIPKMVQMLTTTDTGLVIGSRYVAGGSTANNWPWHRKALSTCAIVYVNAILSFKVKDTTAGFKAWSRAALISVDLATVESNGYSFQVEMNYRTVKQGHRIVEVPIRFEEREQGKSKMSIREQMESMLTPWKLLFGKK